jgi:PAS domain S-box-containing protein
MNTTDHDIEMPPPEAVPAAHNGQATSGVESSKGMELNAQLAQENAKLSQENAQLMQERDLLRRVIDNLPDFIYAKDKQGRFVLNNVSHASDLGAKSPEELKGKSDFDFFPPELAAQFYADEKKIIETGQPVMHQEQYKCKPGDKSGKKYWSVSSKVLWHDAEGRVLGTVGITRDTTEQKRTEARLAYEQQLFQTLLETTPDNIYFKDRESRFVRVSQAKAESTMQAVRKAHRAAHPNDNPDDWPPHLAGVKPFTEWLIGKTDFDTFPEEHARMALAEEHSIISSGQPMIGKLQKVALHDGSIAWLLTTKMPWRDKDGNIIGTLGVTRNVTELKEAEDKLDRERILMRTVIDNVPDFIYAKDKQGHFVLNNVAHAKSFGTTPEGMLGKSDFDFFPAELAQQFFNDEQKIIETGAPVVNQEQFKALRGDKSGEKRWSVSTKVLWRNDEGAILGTVGVTRDVHKMKQMEAKLAYERDVLRMMLESAPDRIYFKDKESRLVLVSRSKALYTLENSPRLRELLKQRRGESGGAAVPDVELLAGLTNSDQYPEEHARAITAEEEEIMRTRQPLIGKIDCMKTADGTTQWSMTSKLPWLDKTGNVIGTFGISRDITELKASENALREGEEKLRLFATQLERSNRELQDFAYVASHDLQEPLRKIVVFGERLKEKSSESLGTDGRDYLDRMQKAAARMQTLITDLLTFSRVTTKAQPFMPVNLAEVATGVVNDLEGRIELVKGRVEVGALPIIDAEPIQMRQLLQNLIGNALKFRRPEEPPVVKVEAQILPDPDTPEKKLCRLTVSDNCIGFDEKYLDRIFNVFQRLHTRNEYEGTGMGLAIVRKIALYHGGDITAKSKLGQGSTFILTIPMVHPKQTSGETNDITTKMLTTTK